MSDGRIFYLTVLVSVISDLKFEITEKFIITKIIYITTGSALIIAPSFSLTVFTPLNPGNS